MGIFVRDDEYFGLDIGSSAIRLVELRRGAANPALVAYGSIPIDHQLMVSDSKADYARVAELVKQLVRDNRIATKNVVLGLPSNKIFATVITTPKLDNAQLAKAIRFQAEQYIPMAIDQVKLDWAVLDQSQDGKQLEVLLVAAPVMAVEKYMSILEQAELEPVALEANALAAGRALVSPAATGAVIVLDFGSLDSDISIFWKHTPRLIRSISVGGVTLVRAVSQSLGLNDVQAQQFTYKFGLTQDKLEGQVYKAIKPVLDGLISEIEKSVKFFSSKYPDVKIEKLVVTGATAALPDLGPFLANSTGMPVEFGNAWANVSYPSSMQDKLGVLSMEYAAAVGLAGRGMLS